MGISEFMIHQMFLLARHWSTHVTWLNTLQLRLVNSRGYSPIFKILYEKYLKDNKQDSLHLAWKYVGRFVLGHYLCLKAHIFPWATLLWTDDIDDVCRQIWFQAYFCVKWRLLSIYAPSYILPNFKSHA